MARIDNASDESERLRPGARSIVPNEHNARVALKASARLMKPVVRWLLRHGVAYPSFAEMLKSVFLDVGREELERDGARVTHSALSIVTGVHRKDVRSLTALPADHINLRALPLASQVFSRWLSDPNFVDEQGRPRVLARTGSGASFETLARRVSADVHPRSVLDELLRLGLVQIVENDVHASAGLFTSASDVEQTAHQFAGRIADHVSAAVHNLTLDGPKFLEQSVYVEGLGEQAAQEFADSARASWESGFAPLMSQAQELHEAGCEGEVPHNLRFGVYVYAEPQRHFGGAADVARPLGAESETPTSSSGVAQRHAEPVTAGGEDSRPAPLGD